MSNRNKVYESNGDIVNNNDRLFLNKSQTLNHKQNELQNVIDEHDGLVSQIILVMILNPHTLICRYVSYFILRSSQLSQSMTQL